LLGLGTLVAFLFLPDEGQRARTDAKKWALATSVMPSTLAELGRLPYEHRRAAVAQMTLAQRRVYLTEHLDAFLLPREQLTPIQAAVLASVGTDLTSSERDLIRWARDTLQEVLGSASDHAGFVRFGEVLCQKARARFTPRTQQLVFGRIGPPDPAYERMLNGAAVTRLSVLPDVRPFMRIGLAKLGLASFECNCADRFCDCETCGDNGPCSVVMYNCGCIQASPCNQLCMSR
jgi:hypothetical protein